jgi:D-glycero-alpha-D-manno-heptose 1-phosphate guanylyltransferase
MKKIQVVVLAGGLGSRLAGHTNGLPKPMVDFGGTPFLERILLEIKKHAIEEITLAVGHQSNAVTSYFLPNWRGLKIKYSVEDVPLGTGGALFRAMDLDYDVVVLVNGDTIQEIPLNELVASLDDVETIASVGISKVSEGGDFGSLELDRDCFVRSWQEKLQKGEGVVYSGVAAIRTAELGALPAGLFPTTPFSFEEDVVPVLLTKAKIKGVMLKGPFYDIGTPARLSFARDTLVSNEK